MSDDRLQQWLRALEERQMADLTFSQVASALRALSSAYVERRHRLRQGAALQGAGKRAAFALFYGPLHFLVVREIVRAIAPAPARGELLIDLGCGTGAAGAAWASLCRPRQIVGIDRHPWALAEAARTYREFGLAAEMRQSDIVRAALPEGPAAIVAAFAVNELDAAGRDALLGRLLGRAGQGDRLLIVEPIAGSAAPWWRGWREAVEAAGGRSDEWRFRTELPPIVAKLDRAAHLDHRELTARSLFLAPTPVAAVVE